MRVGILPTCGKHLHDRIFSQRGEVWAHKSSLSGHFLFKCQKSEQSYICVLGVSIFIFDFGIVPTGNFCFSFLCHHNITNIVESQVNHRNPININMNKTVINNKNYSQNSDN